MVDPVWIAVAIPTIATVVVCPVLLWSAVNPVINKAIFERRLRWKGRDYLVVRIRSMCQEDDA